MPIQPTDVPWYIQLGYLDPNAPVVIHPSLIFTPGKFEQLTGEAVKVFLVLRAYQAGAHDKEKIPDDDFIARMTGIPEDRIESLFHELTRTGFLRDMANA